MIDLEGIERKLCKVVASKEWQNLQEDFNHAKKILFVAHGGNLAIAQHCATQIERHNSGKSCDVPDANYVSIWHGDGDYDCWLEEWLMKRIDKSPKDYNDTIVVGFTSSGKLGDISNALEAAASFGTKTHLISAVEPEIDCEGYEINKIVLDAKHYYASETMTMLLMYELTRGAGGTTELIKSLPLGVDSSSVKPRAHSVSDEQTNMAIDFDGPIHKCSKGFFNGLIYDDPVEGVHEAMKELSQKYNIVVFTCKARVDRPLVDGKTGTELVWNWLEKHDLKQYVTEVTAEKPRAVGYIDDKAFHFSSWKKTLVDLER